MRESQDWMHNLKKISGLHDENAVWEMLGEGETGPGGGLDMVGENK